MPKKQTLQDFITKSINIHGDNYGYSKVIYINNITPVTIYCKQCNKDFEQTPASHTLKNRNIGCPICGLKKRVASRTSNTKEFITKSINVHGTKYDYSLVKYTTSAIKVKIKCNKCMLIFEQKPYNHLNAKHPQGCPKCNQGRYNGVETYRDRKTILYYVKINNLFKIGVTLETVKKRYAKDIKKGVIVEVIKEIIFDDGAEAYLKEQQILKDFKDFKYTGPNILIGGNSELFYTDIIPI